MSTTVEARLKSSETGVAPAPNAIPQKTSAITKQAVFIAESLSRLNRFILRAGAAALG